jgi:hypothetical protein
MLNRFNFSIAALIDTESIGPISGLLVSPTSTVETDGHQLIVVTSPESQPSLFPPDDEIADAEEFTPFILDRDSALKLAKIIPKPKEGAPRELAVIDISTETDGTATLAVNDDDRRTIVKSEKIAGDYPNFGTLIPPVESARFEISFSSDLLGKILSAFEKFSGQITIRLFGANQGARIDAERDGQVMTAVVMPMRIVEQVKTEIAE